VATTAWETTLGVSTVTWDTEEATGTCTRLLVLGVANSGLLGVRERARPLDRESAVRGESTGAPGEAAATGVTEVTPGPVAFTLTCLECFMVMKEVWET
jgi:hypothetical protein